MLKHSSPVNDEFNVSNSERMFSIIVCFQLCLHVHDKARMSLIYKKHYRCMRCLAVLEMWGKKGRDVFRKV